MGPKYLKMLITLFNDNLIIFVQLGFSSNGNLCYFWQTVLRQSSGTEFGAANNMSSGYANEVDTSLVKSQLIYFVPRKSLLHNNKKCLN
jgi:hypothetical protein